MKNKDRKAQNKLGFTKNVTQALEIIKVNSITKGPSGVKRVNKMIGEIFINRHRIGISFAIDRINLFKTVLTLIEE